MKLTIEMPKEETGAGPHTTVVDMQAEPFTGDKAEMPSAGFQIEARDEQGNVREVDIAAETRAFVESVPPAVSSEIETAQPAVSERPSLDVAIENLGHLRPRITSLCLRLHGWDKKTMGTGTREAFDKAVHDFEESAADLGAMLIALHAIGYVANATPLTRKLARMRPGSRVRLLDPDPWRAFYSAEELDALQVHAVHGKQAFLKTGDREVGLVPISKLEVT